MQIKTMNKLTRELNIEETIKDIAQICGLELLDITGAHITIDAIGTQEKVTKK